MFQIDENDSEPSAQSVCETEKLRLTLKDVVDHPIRLPTSWCKQETVCGGARIVFFYTFGCRNTKAAYTVKTSKEVILTEDMCPKVNVVGRNVNVKDIDISDEPITEIEQLENILLKVAGMNLCSGCFVADQSPKTNITVSYEDQMGILRHEGCRLLLANRKQCEFCLRLKKSIYRRQLREKKMLKKKRIHIEASPKEKELIKELRMKKRAATKAQARAKRTLRRCRIDLKNKQSEMDKVCDSKLEELLQEKKYQQFNKKLLERF